LGNFHFDLAAISFQLSVISQEARGHGLKAQLKTNKFDPRRDTDRVFPTTVDQNRSIILAYDIRKKINLTSLSRGWTMGTLGREKVGIGWVGSHLRSRPITPSLHLGGEHA
jgi:hypothetical protein